MTTTDQILAAAERHGPLAVDLTHRAIELACRVHHGELRLNGDPYITHPLAVASIVAGLDADPDTVIAALLHDVVADHSYPVQEVRAAFGDAVADILHEFRRLDGLHLRLGDSDRFLGEMGRMDHRAVVVKIADRLHNMQTISGIARDKQYRKARETAQLVAPLARTVGLGAIAAQLDVLSADTLRRSRPSSGTVAEPWNTEGGLRQARRILRWAATLLLPHAVRHRWLAEWDGEINALTSKRERLHFAIHLVLGLPEMAVDARRPTLAEHDHGDRR